TRAPLFDGESRSITFVRGAFGPNTAPGLEVIRIAEIIGDQGAVLVRTRAPFVPGIDRKQPTFTDPVVLLRPPYRLSFAYAGIARNWREEWRGEIRLPRAIKLAVQDAVTQRTLSISTATLVHVEAPMECISAKSLTECFSARARPAESEVGEKSSSQL